MVHVSVSKARADFAALLDIVQDETVVVERRGQEVGVIISPHRYRELLAAKEELSDVEAFDEAMAEEGENLPWEDVKVDLGWIE